jgi:hypothetical protein
MKNFFQNILDKIKSFFGFANKTLDEVKEIKDSALGAEKTGILKDVADIKQKVDDLKTL